MVGSTKQSVSRRRILTVLIIFIPEAFIPAPGVLTGSSAGSVFASANTGVPAPSNAIIVRKKPAPTAPAIPAAPKRISVAKSNKRPSTSRVPTTVLVKNAPAPMAPKNRSGSDISTHHRASNKNSSRKKLIIVEI